MSFRYTLTGSSTLTLLISSFKSSSLIISSTGGSTVTPSSSNFSFISFNSPEDNSKFISLAPNSSSVIVFPSFLASFKIFSISCSKVSIINLYSFFLLLIVVFLTLFLFFRYLLCTEQVWLSVPLFGRQSPSFARCLDNHHSVFDCLRPLQNQN